jgi:hypothetical protein
MRIRRRSRRAPEAAATNRDTEGRPSERRNRRSACLSDALRFQLDACREDAGLAAIVVADELGFCVAHSGGDGTHNELAAQLPMFVDHTPRQPGDNDDDGLPRPPASLTIETFSIAGATLHACAVASPQARAAVSPAVLARVTSGFTRLLAQ